MAWHGRVDLLSKLFCSAVYSKSLASLTADSAAPLAQTLRSQLNILKNRVRVPCMSHNIPFHGCPVIYCSMSRNIPLQYTVPCPAICHSVVVPQYTVLLFPTIYHSMVVSYSFSMVALRVCPMAGVLTVVPVRVFRLSGSFYFYFPLSFVCLTDYSGGCT